MISEGLLNDVCFFGCFKLLTLLISVCIVGFFGVILLFVCVCMKQGQALVIKVLVHVA